MYLPLLYKGGTNIEIDDYLENVKNAKINDKKLTDKYLLILLFDELTYDMNLELVLKHGKDISNSLGSDICLFNFYSEKMLNEIKVKMIGKEYLELQNFESAKERWQKITYCRNMAKIFEVKKFPAVVFIDIEKYINNKKCKHVFEFPKADAAVLSKELESIIKSIKKDYNDFDGIVDIYKKNKDAKGEAFDEGEKVDNYLLYNNFYNNYHIIIETRTLRGVKEFKDFADIAKGGFNYSKSQFSKLLAPECTGQNSTKPKRDIIIGIGVYLGNDSTTINKYLRLIRGTEADYPCGKREKQIEKWVKEGKGLKEINELLEERGLKTFIQPNRKTTKRE